MKYNPVVLEKDYTAYGFFFKGFNFDKFGELVYHFENKSGHEVGIGYKPNSDNMTVVYASKTLCNDHVMNNLRPALIKLALQIEED